MKTMMNAFKNTVFSFLLSTLLLGGALAADIQVITSGAFAEALKTLVPEYEK